MASDTAARMTRKRKVVRIVCIAVLLVLAAGLVKYSGLLPGMPKMGSGPAGPPVPREPFEKTWREGPVLLLGLGDSITAGFGASPGNSYLARLVKNPKDEFPEMQGICLDTVFPDLKVRNLAVNGSTSIDCLRDQIPQIEAASPDTLGVVVITTGGNDLIHFYGRTPPQEGAMYGATIEQARPWVANFAERLDAIVAGVEAAFPGGCHIFLANIYDPSDGVGDPSAAQLPPWEDVLEVLAAYNDAIAQCAKKHASVHLADIHSTFLGHGVHCAQRWREHCRADDPHYWYYTNLEDPNDRGYDAIRRLFLIAMVEVFAGGV